MRYHVFILNLNCHFVEIRASNDNQHFVSVFEEKITKPRIFIFSFSLHMTFSLSAITNQLI